MIDGRGLWVDERVLVRISSSGGITVRDKRVGCALAYEIDSEATLVYNLDLLK